MLFQVRIKPAYCYPEECSEKEPAFCGDCTSGCIKESMEDKAFHGMLAKVSTAFGANNNMSNVQSKNAWNLFRPTNCPNLYFVSNRTKETSTSSEPTGIESHW